MRKCVIFCAILMTAVVRKIVFFYKKISSLCFLNVLKAERDVNEAIESCRRSYPGNVINEIFDGSHSVLKRMGLQEPIKCFLHCLVRSTGVVMTKLFLDYKY